MPLPVGRPKKKVIHIEYFKELIPRWVMKTLKENGNCYIRHRMNLTMEELSYVIGFPVKKRRTSDGIGWVLERVVE